MRSIEEQRLALECLKLAQRYDIPSADIIADASAFYAFVSGRGADGIAHAITVGPIPEKFAEELSKAIIAHSGSGS